MQLWIDFVDAMRFDVSHPRFADFDAFISYAQGATVAPTVIYVYLLTSTLDEDGCYRVHDFDYQTCGRELGIFAYLAHILRDVREDALVGSTGLVYLSLADLQDCQLRDVDLRDFAQRMQSDARFTKLVGMISARAQSYAQRGGTLVQHILPRMSPDCRFVLQLIVVYYRELLRRVSNPDIDLFAKPSLLDSQSKLQLALQVAAESGFELNQNRLAQAMVARTTN
jgi:phytoene synthase